MNLWKPSTFVASYNDERGIANNPSAYDVAYTRGSNAKPVGRPCRSFFLREGLNENWATLSNTVDVLASLGKPWWHRIISWKHVPNNWPKLAVDGDTYIDFRYQEARTLYKEMLLDFYNLYGNDLYMIDIEWPFSRSGEPDLTNNVLDVIGDEAYLNACLWMIDTYVEVFGPKVCGNIGGRSKFAKVLIPKQVDKGIAAVRQDAFGFLRDPEGNKLYGENRASMYGNHFAMATGWVPQDSNDRAPIGLMLDGRDKFIAVFFEIAGHDAQTPGYEYDKMLGPHGEFWQLSGTLFGEMGQPHIWGVDGIDINRANSDINDLNDYVSSGNVIPPPVEETFPFDIVMTGATLDFAHFGGAFDEVYFNGATEAILPLPIVDDKTWNARVYFTPDDIDAPVLVNGLPLTELDKQVAHTFHTAGRRAANVVVGVEPPIEKDCCDEIERLDAKIEDNSKFLRDTFKTYPH
jgi:hypothetical protein